MIERLFVYILASQRNGTLYIGVTNDLARRVGEHKAKLVPGFTRRYGVDKLVYFEECGSILQARERERALKRWRRAWKLELIEKDIRNGATLPKAFRSDLSVANVMPLRGVSPGPRIFAPAASRVVARPGNA
jgi:putative endonuclease